MNTITLSDEAMAFLQQIDTFWWGVSECTKCQTIVLDSELVWDGPNLCGGCESKIMLEKE